MVSTDQCTLDYADWSAEVDFVSNDHYFVPGESHLDELACSDSLVSGFAGHNPVVSDGAFHVRRTVEAGQHAQTQRRDGPRRPAHVAMGADAVNFFSGVSRAPARRRSTPPWCRTRARMTDGVPRGM